MINEEIKTEDLIALIQTYRSHVDTLDRIIGHIQHTLKLSNSSYEHGDYEEMKKINDEIINFINELMVEEYDIQNIQ